MTNKKTPHRRAGSVLPYFRVDDTYLTHYPRNREAHFRAIGEGLFYYEHFIQHMFIANSYGFRPITH